MLFKHFFWDFDGTMYDSYPRITRTFQKTLKDVGVEADYQEVYMRVKISLPYARQKYIDENPQLNITMEQLAQSYRAHSGEDEEETPILPYAGLGEVLKAIVDMGGENYLYTHRSDGAIDILEKDGFKQYFTDFITSDNGFPLKPAPNALKFMLKRRKLNAQDCVMIGDRDMDLDAAKAVGMHHAMMDPDHAFPDYDTPWHFDTLHELKKALVEAEKE